MSKSDFHPETEAKKILEAAQKKVTENQSRIAVQLQNLNLLHKYHASAESVVGQGRIRMNLKKSPEDREFIFNMPNGDQYRWQATATDLTLVGGKGDKEEVKFTTADVEKAFQETVKRLAENLYAKN